MEKWIEIIQSHSDYAHWFIFGASLLAGMNIPISIDLLMIISATLAATVLATSVFKLFFSIYLGCLFSAWIAYWIGRKLGPKLLNFSFFSKLLNKKHVEKVKTFYEKRGFMTFVFGRFIPFGIRNAIYMSSGISRISFTKFALWDGFACTLWSILCFSIYYLLGKNIATLYSQVKIANLLIFGAFSVTVIAIIWYKKKKNLKEEDV